MNEDATEVFGNKEKRRRFKGTHIAGISIQGGENSVETFESSNELHQVRSIQEEFSFLCGRKTLGRKSNSGRIIV